MTGARRLSMWLVLITLVAAVAEGGAFGALRAIKHSPARFLVWDPDLTQLPKIWADAAGQWDEDLGWPAPRDATAPPRDHTGAKLNTDFPEPGTACAAAYGDSFVWGEEVAPAEGWIEQLSRLIGCRVSNYGVSGYGTDQSFVRFQRNIGEAAPVVILCIFAENVVRNVVDYRSFLGQAPHPLWLKGRFRLDTAGALVWSARPKLDAAGFIALHREPKRILPHGYALPDTRDGPVSIRFPYTIAALRIAMAPRVLTRLTDRPSWADFFDRDHPSGALLLTTAILEAFAREVRERGKHPLVVMLPGASDFRAQVKFGAFQYRPLVEAMTTRKVEVFDAGPALRAALGARSPCELYVQPADWSGHYGVAGGAIVAQVVAAELRRRGWVKCWQALCLPR
jgi:hypothetical protein